VNLSLTSVPVSEIVCITKTATPFGSPFSAPERGVWALFGAPATNDRGEIAFRAQWRGASSGAGIFVDGKDRREEWNWGGPYPGRVLWGASPIQSSAQYGACGISGKLTGVQPGKEVIALDSGYSFGVQKLAREGAAAPSGALWSKFARHRHTRGCRPYLQWQHARRTQPCVGRHAEAKSQRAQCDP
jgi:hypothetical protein